MPNINKWLLFCDFIYIYTYIYIYIYMYIYIWNTTPLRGQNKSLVEISILNQGCTENQVGAFSFSFFLSFFFFWPHLTACGILVPWPGIKPRPPALGAWSLNHWSLNHWTAREVPEAISWPQAYRIRNSAGGPGDSDDCSALRTTGTDLTRKSWHVSNGCPFFSIA